MRSVLIDPTNRDVPARATLAMLVSTSGITVSEDPQ